MKIFKHKTKVEIRFVDIDAFGHVNNAHFLTYFEQARVRYFNDAVGYHYDWSKEGLILAHAEIKYVAPVKFGEDIWIKTRCSHLGNKSMEIEYQIVAIIPGSEEIIKAEGITVTVSFDYTTNKTIPIPEKWRIAIGAFEGGIGES